MSGSVILQCEKCGQNFGVRPSRLLRNTPARFCSKACRLAFEADPQSTVERFWSKMDKNGPVPEHRPELGPCWVWTGYQRKGYGSHSVRGQHVPAHRFSYTLAHGTPPDGMLVCHACDRPLCCRVEHLFLGSPVDNAQDMLRKKRAHDRRGENAGGVKLTEALVREIRAHAGSSTEVAPLYGVTARTVRRIRRGDRWGHIA